MNKFQFIKHLLDTKKFTPAQKERFFKLVSTELGDIGNHNQEILEDIRLIKERLGMGDKPLTEEKTNDIPFNTDFSRLWRSVKGEVGFNLASTDDTLSMNVNEPPATYGLNVPAQRKDLSLHDMCIRAGFTEPFDNEKEENLEVLPKYYFPKSSYLFLFNYNQNKILKSTCHDIDSDELANILAYCKTEKYNFNRHLEEIIKAYERHEKKYFAPTNLKTMFRVYLTGKNYKGDFLNGWTSDAIKINWSCEDLRKWSEKNPGIAPNPSEGIIEEYENTGFEFNRIESKLTGQFIQSFSQIVIHFKHLFHIRSDNSLRAIINRKNQIEQWDEKIDFIIDDKIFPKNIEHFTDIDKLVQAYKRVILLVLETVKKHQLEKPKIKLSASVDSENFKFSIHHLNSIYQKSIINTVERLGQSYGNLIENQVNGLCELYLRADFGQMDLAEINLWNGKPRIPKPFVDDNFTGVEHLFIFPKK